MRPLYSTALISDASQREECYFDRLDPFPFAQARGTTVNQLVNQLLKKDMELIQAAAG